MLLLPISLLLEWASRKKSFVSDFVALSISILLYMVSVRTVVGLVMEDVAHLYFVPAFVGSVIGMVGLRYLLGLTTKASAAGGYTSRTGKYSGFRYRRMP